MPKFVQTFYHIFFKFLNIFESLCQMGVGRSYAMEIPTMLGWLQITTRQVAAISQLQLTQHSLTHFVVPEPTEDCLDQIVNQ